MWRSESFDAFELPNSLWSENWPPPIYYFLDSNLVRFLQQRLWHRLILMCSVWYFSIVMFFLEGHCVGRTFLGDSMSALVTVRSAAVPLILLSQESLQDKQLMNGQSFMRCRGFLQIMCFFLRWLQRALYLYMCMLYVYVTCLNQRSTDDIKDMLD